MRDRAPGQERSKNRKGNSLRIVYEFWKERPGWALGLVVGTAAATAVSLAFPYLLRLIIDAIRSGVSRQQFLRYVALLFGLGVLRVLGEVLMPFIRGRINELYAWRVRNEVFRRILDTGHSFQMKYPSGDVMERLDHDMNELSFFACSVIFRFVGAVLLVVFALVIMVRMHPVLTLLAVLPTGFVVLGWLRLGPKMYALFMRWREKIAEVNNQLQSAFTGIRLVKAFVMEDRLAARFRQTLDKRVDVAVREARMEARIEMFYTAIAETAILLVLWAGGRLVMTNPNFTLGKFVAFNAYVLMLLGPMFDIGRMFVSGRRAQGTAERIEEMKRHPPEVESAPFAQKPQPAELRLEGVTFAYGADGKPALRNVTMSFPLGKKVGIAGTVGAGKSTVFRLLFRLADPQSGRVTLGGKDIREFALDEYRRLFGYAPQEPMLFSDTLRNNIAFGRKEVDEKRLRWAAEVAALTKDLAELPRGWDETVGERGTRLSGGQRERVAIARALAGRPAVIVFDDATSALDAETERELVGRLMRELKDATLIIVSHRLSVLAECDFVYVLDQGEVKEQGRHEELLAKRGLYWRLYQRQLLSEELAKM